MNAAKGKQDMYHLLIIEDDKILNYGLRKCLEDEGYFVLSAENNGEALAVLEKETVDLVVLDVNLPEVDGFEICRHIVSTWGTPVVFLTARDEEKDAVRGFDLGAEDYITKPFSVDIFLKKIAAILRRCYGKEDNAYIQGNLAVHFGERKVFCKEEQVHLSPTEYSLLEIFLRNRNRVLTKDVLMECIWDQSGDPADDHALAVYISRLRSKLGQPFIKTVFGVGYMWGGADETEKTDED